MLRLIFANPRMAGKSSTVWADTLASLRAAWDRGEETSLRTWDYIPLPLKGE